MNINLGNGWSLSSFDWNPIRGKWKRITFHSTFKGANYCTACHWKAINFYLFSIRIQTKA